MKRFILYGGIAKNYQNDVESRNPNIETYYLSNDQAFTEEKFYVKNFENLVDLGQRKTRPLQGISLHRPLTINFSELFDPLSEIELFEKKSMDNIANLIIIVAFMNIK